MEFRVLGPVQALQEGSILALGGPKQRTVLALLLAARGNQVSTDSLIAQLYGDDASPRAKRTVHTFVSNLRATVGERLARSGDGYLLAAESVDADEFESSYRRGRRDLEEDPAQAAETLREALDLWRGHPYADVEIRSTLSAEVSRLEEMRLSALESRIEAELDLGLHAELVGELEVLAEEYPLRETIRHHHMLALYRSGRQGEALRAFSRTRTMLADEMGIDPSPELQALEEAILIQDPGLAITIDLRVERGAILVAELDRASGLTVAGRDQALAERDQLMARLARASHGRVVDVRGLATIVRFSEVESAMQAAIECSNRGFRIAIDQGDLEIGDTETGGPPVTRALRLAAIAHPGQVLLSPEANAALASAAAGGWSVRSLGRYKVPGLDEDRPIHQLLAGGSTGDFPPLNLDRLPPLVATGGRAVAGYELREVLGGGGAIAVRRAYQRSVGREVVLRIIGAELSSDPVFIRRFESEAQRIATIEHPHLAPLLDYWREPDGAYLVTRRLGRSLAETSLGDLGAGPVQLVGQIGAAVATAHDRGIVHGRVAENNVMFDEAGLPYLVDLGLATILQGLVAFPANHHTAPEVAGGFPSVSGDVYSLASLYASLDPDPSEAVLSVIDRARHRDPDERWSTVSDFLDALRWADTAQTPTTAERRELRNPYKGLAAFRESDANDFFGREDLVGKLIEALGRRRVTLVVGPSGIGKSSAVRAGLVPALRAGSVPGLVQPVVTDMYPGSDPFDALREALERVAVVDPTDAIARLEAGEMSLSEAVAVVLPPDSALVLIVDQFEEVFTHVSEASRRRFLEVLSEAERDDRGVVRVVVTMRADFMDRPLANSTFGGLTAASTVLVHVPSDEELTAMITGPAELVGVGVSPALVRLVVHDAQGQPGVLPLLQYTMSELFSERATDVLDIADYETVGGLSGSIGRRAEQAYLELTSEQQVAARALFLRLVNVDESHEDTRRRVRRVDLDRAVGPTALDDVLARFGEHRMLVFDRDPVTRGPTVEVAHEALIREWDRLRGWIDDVRDDLLMRRRVELATRDWKQSDEDASYLLRGGRLEQAESWRDESGMEVGADERLFLTESRRNENDAAERRKRTRRRVSAALSAMLVVAVVLGSVAWAQRVEARRDALVAQMQRLAADSRNAVDEDPDLAMLLALESYEISQGLGADRTPGVVMAAMQTASQASRLLARLPYGAVAVALSPDDRILALDDVDQPQIVHIYDAETYEELAAFDAGGPVGALEFHPDGSALAVGYHDLQRGAEVEVRSTQPLMRMYSTDDWSLIGESPHPCCALHVEFSHDGEYFIAYDQEYLANEVPQSAMVATWDDILVDGLERAAWIPQTNRVLIGNKGEERLRVVAVPDLREVGVVETPGASTGALGVSADGASVAVTDVVNRVALLFAGESAVPAVSVAHAGLISATVSPDGQMLVAQGNSDVVYIAEDDGPQIELHGHSRGAWTSTFDSIGRRLFIPMLGGGTLVWDVTIDGPEDLHNMPLPGTLLEVLQSPDGRMLSTVYQASEGLEFRLIDLGGPFWAGPPVPIGASDYHGHDATGMPAVLDGSFLIDDPECQGVFDIGGQPRSAALWDDCDPSFGFELMNLASGETVFTAGARAGGQFGPLNTPAEGLFALNENTVDMELRSVVDGAAVARLSETLGPFTPVFSRDGERLVYGSQAGVLTIVDIPGFLAGESDAVTEIEASVGPTNYASVGERYVASGHTGETLQVRDREGNLWLELPTATNNPAKNAFGPEDRYLFYVDGLGERSVLRRFPLDDHELAQVLESLRTRDFTVAECQRYISDTDCSVYAQE